MNTPTPFATLTEQTNSYFLDIFQSFAESQVDLVYLADYPQRAETLVEGYARWATSQGNTDTKMKLYGGRIDENPFPSAAEQTGYDGNFDNFTADNMAGIAQLVSQPRIAIASYEMCPDQEWEQVIDPARIVKNQYQSRTGILILENKQWLGTLLQLAGLTAHLIPQRHYNLDVDMISYAEVCQQLQSEKIVLQGGLTTHGGTSGSDTAIIENELQFKQAVEVRKGKIKIARFIQGLHGNYSLVVGNTVPDTTGYGCVQGRLPTGFQFDQPSQTVLLRMQQNLGLDLEQMIIIPGRATAKIVGEPSCTYFPLEGSVHDTGFVYSETVRQQLQQVAVQLGQVAASIGYVGILGFDFLVDINQHVWVNEINARQQGPTTMIGISGERFKQLPDIIKVAYIMAFSSQFADPDFQKYLQQLQTESQEIGQQYGTCPGFYYIKVQTLHPEHERRTVVRDIHLPGIYQVNLQQQTVTLTGAQLRGFTSEAPVTELAKLPEVMLVGSSLHQGTQLPGGKQVFRIAGFAESTMNSPVEYDEKQNTFYLKPSYKQLIACLYDHLFSQKH